MPPRKLAMGPGPTTPWFHRLIEPTGCEVTDDLGQADGLVWYQTHTPDGLRQVLNDHPNITWVQLPAAGVEQIVAAGLCAPHNNDSRVWTAAQGVYASPWPSTPSPSSWPAYGTSISEPRPRRGPSAPGRPSSTPRSSSWARAASPKR